MPNICDILAKGNQNRHVTPVCRVPSAPHQPDILERAARKIAMRYGLNMPSARLVVELAGVVDGGRHA